MRSLVPFYTLLILLQPVQHMVISLYHVFGLLCLILNSLRAYDASKASNNVQHQACMYVYVHYVHSGDLLASLQASTLRSTPIRPSTSSRVL